MDPTIRPMRMSEFAQILIAQTGAWLRRGYDEEVVSVSAVFRSRRRQCVPSTTTWNCSIGFAGLRETAPVFLRTIAEAAFTADLNDYNLLRPCLNSRGNGRNQPEGLYVRALSTFAEIVLLGL
jgi:hypothetical protein